MSDEVVTHDEVLRWLPASIRGEWAQAERDRVMAMPPQERGWWTEDEMEADGGRFVEVTRFSDAHSRFYRTGP